MKFFADRVQTTSEKTGNGISGITQVIIVVNEAVGTIATAVEKQTTTTREIAENIARASQGTQKVNENVSQSSTVAAGITENISIVSSISQKISDSSQGVGKNAQEL